MIKPGKTEDLRALQAAFSDAREQLRRAAPACAAAESALAAIFAYGDGGFGRGPSYPLAAVFRAVLVALCAYGPEDMTLRIDDAVESATAFRRLDYSTLSTYLTPLRATVTLPEPLGTTVDSFIFDMLHMG